MSSPRARPATTNDVVARVDRADGTVGVYPLEGSDGLAEYWDYRWRKYGEQLWKKRTAEPERVAFARWVADQDRADGARAGARDADAFSHAEPPTGTARAPTTGPWQRHPVLHDAGGLGDDPAVDPVCATAGSASGSPRSRRRRSRSSASRSGSSRRSGCSRSSPILDPFFGREGALPVRELATRRLDAVHPGPGLAADLGAVVGGRARRGRAHRRLPARAWRPWSSSS